MTTDMVGMLKVGKGFIGAGMVGVRGFNVGMLKVGKGLVIVS